jgi:coatomer protein complex subunit alpha (xenin)
VLSGCFDDNEAFVYSTHKHVKYLISDDSFGNIMSLTQHLYVICVAGSTLHYIDRAGVVGSTKVNMEECNYKMNVRKGRLAELNKQLASGALVGSLAVRYLEKQGLPELALKYEKDEKNKFALALASGNLEVALYSAIQLKKKDCFASLAAEAIKQANFQVAETCFQKMLAFDKLSFLYILTGNAQKLDKMMLLAKNKLKDPMLRYQIAVARGDIPEQVRLLAEVGQVALAYELANKHSLHDLIQPLAESISSNARYNPDLLKVSIPYIT